MDPTDPISLTQAATLLGYSRPSEAGRKRLAREVETYEKRTGRAIMTQTGKHRRLDFRALRQAFPEKFRRTQEDLAKEIREMARRMADRAADRVADKSEAETAALRMEIKDFRQAMRELFGRIHQLEIHRDQWRKKAFRAHGVIEELEGELEECKRQQSDASGHGTP